MNAANSGARVLIGSGGDRAGIQDDDFGRAGIARAFQAAIGQLPLDGRAVSLRRAAAEVLHMVRRHRLIILSIIGCFACGVETGVRSQSTDGKIRRSNCSATEVAKIASY